MGMGVFTLATKQGAWSSVHHHRHRHASSSSSLAAARYHGSSTTIIIKSIHSTHSCNALLAAYSNNRLYNQVIQLYYRIIINIKPDAHTYPTALKACAATADTTTGQRIHARIIKSGYISDVVVATSLLRMYAKCCGRHLEEDSSAAAAAAAQVFDEMQQQTRDVPCWNNLISCYYQAGRPSKSLQLFHTMLDSGFKPNSVTFTLAFSACARLADPTAGDRIHKELIRSGIQPDGYVTAAIVDMYGKCGRVDDAWEVFNKMTNKSVVSWNSMIGGYASHGYVCRCMELFARMSRECVRPTATTISNLLMACSRTWDLRHGRFVHGYLLRNHVEVDVFVNSSILDLYLKCGNAAYAESAFARMPKGNAVLWNVMISGYISTASYFKALDMFREMTSNGVGPDAITFTTALSACAQLAALEQGREIHKQMNDYNMESNEVLMCALLDMYSKCGAVAEARNVFDQVLVKDTVSWTSMISAYATHGRSLEALELFREMQKLKAKPDNVTYLAVISACNHGGLVEEGRYHFNQMTSEYGIKPALEHYSCLIDLLGRSGRLLEAYNILKGMHETKPDAGILGSLFSACSRHGNLELGEEVAGLLIELNPDDHSTYVVLSNMYASLGRWDEVRRVRAKIKDKGLKKNPGCSWIEIEMKIHQFFVEDESHQQAEMIYRCLGSLSRHMEKDKLQFPAGTNEMAGEVCKTDCMKQLHVLSMNGTTRSTRVQAHDKPFLCQTDN